jgi:hypothetical protein
MAKMLVTTLEANYSLSSMLLQMMGFSFSLLKSNQRVRIYVFFKEFLFTPNIVIIHRKVSSGNHPKQDLANHPKEEMAKSDTNTTRYGVQVFNIFVYTLKAKYPNMVILLITFLNFSNYKPF